LQAEVDLLAEIMRQPRDFAFSSHIFFIFFLPSFTFIHLHSPSLTFIGTAPAGGFLT